MRRHEAHWTRWLQWAVAASVLVALGTVVFAAFLGQPRDTLYITVGELRSHAAEAQQIAHGAGALRLTSTFTRAQSEQLALRIASLRNEVVEAEPKARNKTAAREAGMLAEQLLDATRALASRAHSPPAAGDTEKQFEAVLKALLRIERSVRP